MQKEKDQLVLTRHDHETILGYLRMGIAKNTYSKQEAQDVEAGLRRAKVVNEDMLPEDVVRLNSVVTIKDKKDGKVMELMVVTPEQTDIRQGRISIMSPIGTALIGFRKGSTINWKVPAGRRTFQILEVKNLFHEFNKRGR